MRRKIIILLVIGVCFLLQSSVFPAIAFADIVPNLMIIVVSSFGFMNGKREGLWVGFVSGLIIDIFFGFYLGIYALIYMYIGYMNGIFSKHFYPDDIKLPIAMISVSDLVMSILTYFLMYIFRGRFHFGYYFLSIMIPELIYTMIISVFVYYVLLKINQQLQLAEKRRAKKFEF